MPLKSAGSTEAIGAALARGTGRGAVPCTGCAGERTGAAGGRGDCAWRAKPRVVNRPRAKSARRNMATLYYRITRRGRGRGWIAGRLKIGIRTMAQLTFFGSDEVVVADGERGRIVYTPAFVDAA